MADEGLIKYNTDGALDNILAMEEHLTGSNEIPIHNWCFSKHGRLCSAHHLRELKEHTSNPELAKKVSQFKDKFDKARNKNPPDVNEIRELRNEFREIIEDPTLNCKDSVCSLDKLNPSYQSLPITTNSVEDEKSYAKPLFLIGTSLIIGFICVKAFSK